MFVQGHNMSISAGKSIKTTHENHRNQTNTTTRKSPSQTCVSPAETAKQTAKHQKRGRSPNKTPTNSICQGIQWLDHCITLKNMRKNELRFTAFKQTCRPSQLACLLRHRCALFSPNGINVGVPQLYTKQPYT